MFLFFSSCGVVAKYELSFMFAMRLQSFSIKCMSDTFFRTTALWANENVSLQQAEIRWPPHRCHSESLIWALSRSPWCNLRQLTVSTLAPANPSCSQASSTQSKLFLGSLSPACFHTWQRNRSCFSADRCLPLTCLLAEASPGCHGAKPVTSSSQGQPFALTPQPMIQFYTQLHNSIVQISPLQAATPTEVLFFKDF